MRKFTYTDMIAHLGISSAHPGGSMLTRKIFASENIMPDMKLLDIGCGTGETATFLAKEYNCEIIAIDTHSTMINKAKKRFDNAGLAIKLIKANAEKLPFSDGIFDYIIAESVITFTHSNLSLPEFARVLKKSGKLLAIEMTAEEKLSATEKKEISQVYGVKQVLLETEWKEKFANAGFSEVIIEQDNERSNQIVSDNNDPSDFIDPKLFGILQSHTELLQKYSGRLGYRVFRCIK
ncbi:class I SAM-dependent methyltransferase [Anaerobacillus sp. CMMVII]|uniref:class I SAM-dependent methyltransferase n=1 Tax=Anaerobacillus sp. CMMVII TaxID=2755588 RepID=UPI0021B8082B|nr:methyltransferase domain-containing protein [Anaerobacillus sp. CMMVII]MCT8138775.1 class I SAM-dependent methyltransferase [Anaerobacillus sp. CMMVII]